MNDSTGLHEATTTGTLTLPGVQGRFVRTSSRRLRIAADGLRPVRSYRADGAAPAPQPRIDGRARVLGGGLVHATLPHGESAAKLTVSPLETAEARHVLLRIGVDPDAQAGERFILHLFAPPALYAALEADLKAGTAERLSFGAATSLWSQDGEHRGEDGEDALWLLAPPAAGASEEGRGLVETLEWQGGSSRETAAAEAPAPQAAKPEEPEEAPLAEELGRLNWNFKLLLLVLASLMIVVAIK